MTLLELITNCINFTTQDEEELNPSNLETFRNSSNYRAFIKNALPEINRAIQELVILKKIPMRVFETEMVNNIDLPEDVYSIYKIDVKAKDSLYSPVEYRRIGNKIKLPIIYQAQTTYIKYHPKIRLLSKADYNGSFEDNDDGIDNSLDLNEVGLSDTICSAVIPYLVKANIWQEIEPELAQLSRNLGLQNATLLESVMEEPYQTSIARTNDWGE